MTTAEDLLQQLQPLASPTNQEGMARFGIRFASALGVKLPVLRDFAKPYRKQHQLALDLWKHDIHEAKLLAIFIADPKQITEEQMEEWVHDFNSWDICDQACLGLFSKTPIAFRKAAEWATREREFEKRAGFALMAALAVHHKKEPDNSFLPFLGLIEQQAWDERNFVKKAVNWTLRQMGKRSPELRTEAIATALRIQQQPHKPARWIAADALRELNSESVKKRQHKEPA